MEAAPLPDNEDERLAELLSYDVLDTEAEQLFDDLTTLASQICDTPIALISLIDPDRQWFKSRVGLDAEETSREIAFCSHAILQDDVFEIPNASLDPRFHDNPLVTGAPDIRFYAGAPLVSPSGHAIGTLCTIDRKPRKLTESQKTSLQTLSKSVVAHLELKRKNRELERTSQFRSDFLSYVSHEIRTPLNAINTFSRLLEGEAQKLKLPESFTTPLSHVTQSGERLLEIVNSVLDIKQIEAGKMRVMPRAVSTHDFFTHLFSLTKIRAEDGGITFTTTIDSRVPDTLFFDDTKFGQVALNLLSNAIKFTSRGKSVSAQVKYKNDKLIFNVIDQGIGISEEDQKRLFTPFERMENAHQISGTGLGLNISKRLIELMDGTIKVSSKVNEGTRISVTLPSDVLTANEFANAQPQSFVAQINIDKSARVLVVEDHYINQVVIQTLFEKLGVAHAIVNTGEEGVKYVNANPVDLVLMDLNLPGIQGDEATAQIKSINPELPVIALTADAITKPASLYEKGLDDVLTKPVDSNELVRVLNQFLAVKRN
ncbi:GAF domain-containing hybrid sensor histidine kinase/response regulator [Alteromonas mediterranea]|jgi:signal transduction histidine kinase|uniref:histidine kinase n=1 Tax=Alteromonas mediterranea TaxID=314275 RepID=A0AAC8XLY1_9ALTE|nr:GAF domain-containing hybrid sensor histidine kinase/response regulator [Alteromonas mediterranea]AFV86478.1 histidine kinase response regulator hybrid protein [Alteromonas mediterranea DE1]AGP98490.1 histidine kinase response regulator hybrid protein [Alteromonas mediterranea UM7]AMJ79451.1 hybrid sensor histidine kinase/response regulator [Alteromonas mediterranea]AMJ83608.1 hybrid sensor histidine kinase/response regulator [Alteromonas mediterranea]HBL21804.1 hybrid sensor histidine kina|tara:strand:+ start:701 stop:2329 length:1629 start_codon:yes stop_codon:yes gene_type:complete